MSDLVIDKVKRSDKYKQVEKWIISYIYLKFIEHIIE